MPNESLRVLAVDIGIRHAAMVVVEGRRIIAHERIVSKHYSLNEVIQRQCELLLRLLMSTYHGGTYIIALELPYLGKNRKTFYELSQLIGALKATALIMHSYPVQLVEFPANRVRAYITGSGSSSKEELYQVLSGYFQNTPIDKYFDSSDALALGIYVSDQYRHAGDCDAEKDRTMRQKRA